MSKEHTAVELIEEIVHELNERGDTLQAAALLGATHAMYGWLDDGNPYNGDPARKAEAKAYVLMGAAALYAIIPEDK